MRFTGAGESCLERVMPAGRCYCLRRRCAVTNGGSTPAVPTYQSYDT